MTNEEALEILDTIPTIGEQVDALEMAIKALSKDVAKKPIIKPDGFGLTKTICPNCGLTIYDSDWYNKTKEMYHTRRCQGCGQLFTKLGRHLGEWEDEE